MSEQIIYSLLTYSLRTVFSYQLLRPLMRPDFGEKPS